VIVFARSRQHVEAVRRNLEGKVRGVVRVLHANKGQNARINAIEAFKDGEVRVLVATDVAARGIDVTMVSHVINFDVPVLYEEYVHRIGRTGRANQTGEAITYCTPAEVYHLRKIEELIRTQVPEIPLPAEVERTATPFEEQQDMARAIDVQRRKEDPNYKGAFHEKKYVLQAQAKGKKVPGKKVPTGALKARKKGKGPAGPRSGKK
jgi:ATP-dependent RNA helicase RhlE